MNTMTILFFGLLFASVAYALRVPEFDLNARAVECHNMITRKHAADGNMIYKTEKYLNANPPQIAEYVWVADKCGKFKQMHLDEYGCVDQICKILKVEWYDVSSVSSECRFIKNDEEYQDCVTTSSGVCIPWKMECTFNETLKAGELFKYLK